MGLWDRKQTLDYLQPYTGLYGNGPFGASYLDQYRNNQVQQWALQGKKSKIDPGVYNTFNDQFNAGKLNAGIGMGLSTLQGIDSLASQAVNNSRINDQSQYYNMLDGIRQVGTGNYNDYGQLMNEQQRLGNVDTNDYDDIRGMTGAQKVGSIASSTITGLTAGSAFGPVGMAVGAGAGFLTGALSTMRGDANASAEYQFGNALRKQAIAQGQENVNAAKDYMDENNNRIGAVRSRAEGGKIEKKQLTVKEFADLVLNRQRSNDSSRSAGIVHRKCKGGTMVRIKVK